MTVNALSTRLRAISHDWVVGGYDRNPVAFGGRKLWLIQRSARQVIQSLDSVDCEGGSQAAVSDVDTGRAVFVHPTSTPTTVLLLKGEKSSKVHFVPDPNRRASKDPHGEG